MLWISVHVVFGRWYVCRCLGLGSHSYWVNSEELVIHFTLKDFTVVTQHTFNFQLNVQNTPVQTPEWKVNYYILNYLMSPVSYDCYPLFSHLSFILFSRTHCMMPTISSKCVTWVQLFIHFSLSHTVLCLSRDGSVVIDQTNEHPLSLHSCCNRKRCRSYGTDLYNHLWVVRNRDVTIAFLFLLLIPIPEPVVSK